MGCEEGNPSADSNRSRFLLIRNTDCRLSTTITSFFKVMIGDELSSVMIVPPKFAGSLSMLVNQKFDLEDFFGKRWKVTLSNHNGFPAFREGWHEFFLDHGLEEGHFLVFYHLEESHFVVQIYNRTGCEYLDFPWKKSPNVTCDGRVGHKRSVAKQSPATSVFRSNVGIKQAHFDVNGVEAIPVFEQKTPCPQNNGMKAQPIPYEGWFSDEISCIVDRSLAKKGECRNSLIDLSSFEMFKTVAGGLVEDGKQHGILLSKSQTGACEVLPSEVSNVKILEETKGSNVDNDMIGKEKFICNGKNIVNLSAGRPSNDQTSNQSVPKKKQKTPEICCNGHAGGNEMLTSQKKRNLRSESNKRKIDKHLTVQGIHDQIALKTQKSHSVIGPNSSSGRHPGIFNLPVKKEDNKVAQQILKSEPVEFVSPSAASISCLVKTNDRTFLELPECLPRPVGKGRFKMNRCLVVLRNTKGIECPVMCHHTPSFTILGSGWEVFCKDNNIRDGHRCTFQVEPDKFKPYTPREVHEVVYTVSVEVPNP